MSSDTKEKGYGSRQNQLKQFMFECLKTQYKNREYSDIAAKSTSVRLRKSDHILFIQREDESGQSVKKPIKQGSDDSSNHSTNQWSEGTDRTDSLDLEESDGSAVKSESPKTPETPPSRTDSDCAFGDKLDPEDLPENEKIDQDPSNMSEYEICDPEFAKNVYKTYAEEEISEMKANKEKLTAEDISTILLIRTISQPKPVKLHIEFLKIEIGFRRIKFTIITPESDEPSTIEYKSNKKPEFLESSIKYGDNKVQYRRPKYQQMAASDFFYLMKSNYMTLKQLTVDIEKIGEKDPPIYPFDTFIKQSRILFANGQIKIRASSFSMTTFNKGRSMTTAGSLIMQLLPRFEPGMLENIRFRLWNDDKVTEEQTSVVSNQKHLLEGVYGTEQWKNAKYVDIDGKGISVDGSDYDNFCHFERVQTAFPRENQTEFAEEIKKIANAFQNIKHFNKAHKCTFVIPPELNTNIVNAHSEIEKLGVWNEGKTEEGLKKAATTLLNGVQMEIRKSELNFVIVPEELEKVDESKKLKTQNPEGFRGCLEDIFSQTS